ncbi:MAG: hydantoinase [Ignavibacteriales bacterium]|nr:hydantoinase [Ignavibacteriales bacterium]
MQRKIKIGIDVGGTFTHAVAIDTATVEIIGKACVPTTHSADEGVALGVINSMHELILHAKILPEEIILIAHSTTQATNALLEGDVAVVGIICLGQGFEARFAKKSANLGNIELSPGKYLKTHFIFINTGNTEWKNEVPGAIAKLKNDGSETIVATEVFGVDDPVNEDFVCSVAESNGMLATAAGRISRLYGLRVRTRTAAINASMMPKMLNTANMTEKAIRGSGINAPLMVMRSDGGIMDIEEMRKRPILTMLSGPAAGVAAALRYMKISDGIFLEVGGTSTDISVIKNGKPQIRSAQIGKNRLFVRTLDVRTLGIAGGSVPRISNNKIIDVGPRSAHIAKLQYAGYSNTAFNTFTIERFSPLPGDPNDYMRLRLDTDAPLMTITPTEASYFLGLVKETGHGSADMNRVKRVFLEAAKILGTTPELLAEEILKLASQKIEPVIKRLIREYKLEEDTVQLLGGGGGASAIVPYFAQHMHYPHSIAKNTEIVSAIGAALGIIKDSIEKNIINPTESELIDLRRQAIDSVMRMGAKPDSIEVTVEIDSRNKKVNVTAYGSGEMTTGTDKKSVLTENDIAERAAMSLKTTVPEITLAASTEFFLVYEHIGIKKILFGLWKEKSVRSRVLDRDGIIRLQLHDCVVKKTTVSGLKETVTSLIQELTAFGDAGALVPSFFVLAEQKIIDLAGLITESQIISLAELELQNLPSTNQIVVIAARKS